MPFVMSQKSAHNAIRLEREIWSLLKQGRLREAATECDTLTTSYPEHESGWHTASHVAMSLNQPAIALQAIEKALQLSPGKTQWLVRKLACLGVVGDISAAMRLAGQLKNVQLETAADASTYGLTLNRLGLHDQAETAFRRALELEPDNGSHHYNLATILRFLGRLQEAEEHLDRAIALNPLDYESQHLRSGLRVQTRSNNHIQELEAALKGSTEGQPGHIQLCFALAKEYEDIEEYAQAFHHLSQGASARRDGMDYHPERDLKTIRAIIANFGKDAFSNNDPGFVNAEPIFVLGMPRTGTTLVDRILAAHPVVRSVGELQTFGVEIVNQCRSLGTTMPKRPADLVSLTRRIDFEALGEAYIRNARPKTDAAAHFVDKLPMNYLYLGLIRLALPKAKIVCLVRDPLDTCYAVYKTLFQGAYPFSYDLDELANYYVAYHELMAHWQEMLPGDIHMVRYEDLVSDAKAVTESLLDYCELTWDDACLEFYESRDAVTTASATQVRQAMHGKSIGKWRHYEQQLQSVVRILNDAGITSET
jgi:tetratricopeptide (TPR) repeat protein